MTANIDAVVMKIVDTYGLAPDSSFNIPWPVFVRLMASGYPPVYTCTKTIRDKWQILHALGYLVQVNQYASSVNVQRIFTEVVPRVRGEQ